MCRYLYGNSFSSNFQSPLVSVFWLAISSFSSARQPRPVVTASVSTLAFLRGWRLFDLAEKPDGLYGQATFVNTSNHCRSRAFQSHRWGLCMLRHFSSGSTCRNMQAGDTRRWRLPPPDQLPHRTLARSLPNSAPTASWSPAAIIAVGSSICGGRGNDLLLAQSFGVLHLRSISGPSLFFCFCALIRSWSSRLRLSTRVLAARHRPTNPTSKEPATPGQQK